MKAQLQAALAAYAPQPVDPDPSRWQAAVLVLLYEHEGRIHVVFQKRTETVDAHKGQISFPGGGVDPGDLNLQMTALRETQEEIGVDPEDIDLLGELDQLTTISNFIVTPYVGWMRLFPYTWQFSEHEVAYLLEVPLDHLRDPANFVPDRRVMNGGVVTLPAYRFGDDLIWGVTARILSNFLDIWTAAEALPA
jgi:8-oxo-dGTP pyrophosphatase MutT (NUDIX family)